MIDLLGKLASAIATAEGFFAPGDTPPKRNHNPGDLRSSPWLANAKIQGGFWVAESDAQGIAGLYHDIALNIARGATLRQLMYRWAPPSDGNNTSNYLKETARRVGITNVDQPLQELLEIERIP